MFSFLKKITTSCLGMLLGMILSIALLFGILAVVLSSIESTSFSSTPPKLSDSSVLHLKLEGNVVEREEETPLSFIQEEIRELGLEEIRRVVQFSTYSHQIKAIYLEVGNLIISPAAADEIRQLLLQFRESGKTIIAYADNYTQNGYYIASVANRVFINPQGAIDLKGLASRRIFYKNAFDRWGVKMQIFRVGEYKSAVEPYTRTAMSEESREQTQHYLQNMWDYQLAQIADARSIPLDTLQTKVNQGLFFQAPLFYHKAHLVDSLLYASEAVACLKRDFSDEKNNFTLIKHKELLPFTQYRKGKEEIAVLYAEGEIVGSLGGLSPMRTIAEKAFCKEIIRLKEDKKVKAVVLRINSPGGSAYSSEQIWKELQLLNQQKPLIVSMGSYAASGGYYIASAASHIVASPLTVTGSIGIFGMLPDLSGVTEKIGLTFDEVKTNDYASFPSLTSPMTPEEHQLMQGYVDRGYALFLKRCLGGRPKFSSAHLDSIAQGRVWTGRQALEIGLIDELGSLEGAIHRAAQMCGTTDYTIRNYPAPKDWIDRLLLRTANASVVFMLQGDVRFYKHLFEGYPFLPATDYLQALLPDQLQNY